MAQETSAQFYDRMEELGELSARHSGQRGELDHAFSKAMRDAAVAGYQQALRDMAAHFASFTSGEEWTAQDAALEVTGFAEARGLDMDGATR